MIFGAELRQARQRLHGIQDVKKDTNLALRSVNSPNYTELHRITQNYRVGHRITQDYTELKGGALKYMVGTSTGRRIEVQGGASR